MVLLYLTINSQTLLIKSSSSSAIGEGSEIASAATIVSPAVQQRLGLPPIPSGAAGSLTINTPFLSVLNRGRIKVDNEGVGNAGNLQVNANAIYLNGGSTIEAATAVGEGGNLSLQAQTIVLRDRSAISATAGGAGKGGNISIDSPLIVGLENSDIIANAVKGRGGNIDITTQGLFGLEFRSQITQENDITASSEFGINGNVQVNTIGINPANALNTLPVDIVDSSRQITDRCGAAKTSSFIATGRGGMPQGPMKKKGADRSWHDLRPQTASNSVMTPVAITNPIQPLIEASAFQVDESGSIMLIAAKPMAIQPSATCAMGQSN